MNKIDPTLNPLEVIKVCDDLAKQGITHYTLAPGNNCIWAYYGFINKYYIFREGELVDIQVD